MSKRVISGEQLERYERWEWNSLGQGSKNTTPQKISTAAGDIPVQTRALDLEQLQQKAMEEARAEGYAQAREQVQAEVAHLQQVMQQAEQGWREMHQEAAAQILNLALELSRHILRQEIVTHPDSILPVVREALDTLTDNGSHAQLILHPADAVLVRDHLSEDLRQGQWKIIEDKRLHRGGCRISTSHGEVDASIETRWARMIEALGCNLPWNRPEGS